MAGRGEPHDGREGCKTASGTNHQQRASVGFVPRQSAKGSAQVDLIDVAHLTGE
jgi:hypothetical protein